MSSTNKTEELGLNQWVGTDVPKMEDFNNDNALIDKAISDHIWSASAHVTMEQKKAWSNPINCAVYLGDGADTRRVKLNLGFEPSICFVFAVSQPPSVADFGNNMNYNYFGIATINGSMVGLNLDGNYLEVATGATTAVFERQCYNQLGKSYLVIGFR